MLSSSPRWHDVEHVECQEDILPQQRGIRKPIQKNFLLCSIYFADSHTAEVRVTSMQAKSGILSSTMSFLHRLPKTHWHFNSNTTCSIKSDVLICKSEQVKESLGRN